MRFPIGGRKRLEASGCRDSRRSIRGGPRGRPAFRYRYGEGAGRIQANSIVVSERAGRARPPGTVAWIRRRGENFLNHAGLALAAAKKYSGFTAKISPRRPTCAVSLA